MTELRRMEYGSAFAGMIKEAREKKGLTQRELAGLVNRSHGNIARIEGSHTVPKKENAIREIAKALDIDEEELVEEAWCARQGREDLITVFPAIYSLVLTILDVSSDEDLAKTLNMFEKRLFLLRENEEKLAANFINYLTGRLGLTDDPENGLRPISHYFMPWCSKIEEWYPK